MTSKVKPAAGYWTDDVKSAAHTADYWTQLTKETGEEIVLFWWAEKQRAK